MTDFWGADAKATARSAKRMVRIVNFIVL